MASILSVAALDFFFVPPFFTLAIADVRFLVTFSVMLIAALTVSTLTLRVRGQADAALQRERTAAVLSAMGREFSQLADPAAIADVAIKYIDELVELRTSIMLRTSGTMDRVLGDRTLFQGERNLAVMRWVIEHVRPAGLGTETLPGASALFLPLGGAVQHLGVIACAPRAGEITVDQGQLLEIVVDRTAGALERVVLATQAVHERVRAESERTRSTLLAGISHDLRTPLVSIAGAASVLEDTNTKLDPNARRELLSSIREQAERLSRLVSDLLELTRLEACGFVVEKQWIPLEEVFDSAVRQCGPELVRENVQVDVPREVLSVPGDPVLIEHVIINLLENAAKYAGPASPIELSGWREQDGVVIAVEDRGPGVPRDAKERIFEKFYRAHDANRTGGAGLGLAVCKAIVVAHHGSIKAENRPQGGLEIRIELPIDREMPQPIDSTSHVMP